MEIFLNICNTIVIVVLWVNLSRIQSIVARLVLYIPIPFLDIYLQLTGLYQDIVFAIGYFYLAKLALTKYLYPQNPTQPRLKIIEFIFYLLFNSIIIYHYAINSDATIQPWYLFVAILLGLLAGHTEIRQRQPTSSDQPPTSAHFE